MKYIIITIVLLFSFSSFSQISFEEKYGTLIPVFEKEYANQLIKKIEQARSNDFEYHILQDLKLQYEIIKQPKYDKFRLFRRAIEIRIAGLEKRVPRYDNYIRYYSNLIKQIQD